MHDFEAPHRPTCIPATETCVRAFLYRKLTIVAVCLATTMAFATPICLRRQSHVERCRVKMCTAPMKVTIQKAAPATQPLTHVRYEGKRCASRVLIIGATGRAGAYTARALAEMDCAAVCLTVAGRDSTRGDAVVRSVRALCSDADVRFERIDLVDSDALVQLVRQHDVVLHTAGPFQCRSSPCEVLQACLNARVDYIDVCDDVSHARRAKTLDAAAKNAGMRAIVCAGVYPGLSNIAASSAVAQLSDLPTTLELFYYTAGSGGIGATVLASTFLILGEQTISYERNRGLVPRPPASDPQLFDFGGKVGRRTVFLLNLPEVPSLYDTLLAPNGGGDARAKFCTGPPFWNALLQAFARYAPRKWLASRDAMQWFAALSLPIVRFVDMFSGARTAFVVRVKGGDKVVTVTYEHESLAKSVGEATAAFVLEVVRDRSRSSPQIQSGVFYPEELPPAVRTRICRDAVRTADRFVVTNDPA